jgi:uncharacterized membrane protein YeaQ/YmgE (transglycosylase-associated protein family)
MRGRAAMGSSTHGGNGAPLRGLNLIRVDDAAPDEEVFMAAIGWIIAGLLAAWAARATFGTSAAGGRAAWAATGVVGAMFGGTLGWIAGLGAADALISPGTWLSALVGALIALGFRQAAASGVLGRPEIRERNVRPHDR